MAVQNLTMPFAGKAAVPVTPTQADLAFTHRLAGWNIGIAISALSIGVTLGVFQGLEHAGINL